MARLRLGGRMERIMLSRNATGLAAVIALLAVAVLAVPAFAGSLSPDDRKCLACHQTEGLAKQLPNGESLSLHIAGDAFGKSVHGAFGCATCHSDIDLAKHPADAPSISSKRSFSIARIQVCAGCHNDKFDDWTHSVHAALVREGNTAAPVCTSCHSPHTMVKGAAASMDTVPCKICHGDIFAAYSTSVHGMLRSAGITQAPLCFSCHGAHSVRVPTANQGMKDVCLGCHKEALVSHQKWLPNAQLHFEAITCPACHSPTAHRTVQLVLFNSTTHKDASRPLGVPEFKLSEQLARGRPYRYGSGDALQIAANAEPARNPRQDERQGTLGRAHRCRGAQDCPQQRSDQRLQDLPSGGSQAVPKRDDFRRQPERHSDPFRRQQRSPQFRLLDQFHQRLLCHRRHQDRIPGCPSGPRARRCAVGGSMAHWGLRWICQRRRNRAQHDKRKE